VSRVLQLSAFSNGWRVRVALRWLAQRADARRHSSAHPDYQRIHRRAATHAFWIWATICCSLFNIVVNLW